MQNLLKPTWLQNKDKQSKNNNNNLNTNNTDNMDLAFVINGHYRPKGSQNSKDGSTSYAPIRVIGQAEKGEEYFELADGRVMHEVEILENYELMNVSTHDTKKVFKNIGDLADVPTPAPAPTPALDVYNTGRTIHGTADMHQAYGTNSQIKIEEVQQAQPKMYAPPAPINEELIFRNKMIEKLRMNEHKSFNLNFNVRLNIDLSKVKDLSTFISVEDLMRSVIENNIESFVAGISASLNESPIVENKNVVDKNGINGVDVNAEMMKRLVEEMQSLKDMVTSKQNVAVVVEPVEPVEESKKFDELPQQQFTSLEEKYKFLAEKYGL